MIRIEIFANRSIHDQIINNLESLIPDFMYSIIPMVQGKEKNSYKLGTTTWSENNFILISYCDDNFEKKIEIIINYIKSKFPNEGIKLFILHENK